MLSIAEQDQETSINMYMRLSNHWESDIGNLLRVNYTRFDKYYKYPGKGRVWSVTRCNEIGGEG